MEALTLDLSEDSSSIVIIGSVREVWGRRRLAIFLRDYLDASLLDEKIVVPVGPGAVGPKLKAVETSLVRDGFQVNRASRLQRAVAQFLQSEQEFTEFSLRAREIWANKVDTAEFTHFVETLAHELKGRTLYSLQLLAAYHLAFAQNAANFSAPGAGKTSIVYGAFAYLRTLPSTHPKFVNRILVVGPLSSFGPWESEFQECFLRAPRSFRLSGGVSPEYRKRVLYSELPEFEQGELFLTSYQSVAHDLPHLKHFLSKSSSRTMVVLDEAHKIKNSEGGVWAESVMELANLGASRVVLTGTPAPNGYEDLYNLFRFIWPNQNVIGFHLGHLKEMTQNQFDPRIGKLIDNVSPFFIRIRKADLHLPAPIEHSPIKVEMSARQSKIYRFIEERYIAYLESRGSESWLRDTLTRARLIRLMQAATNPGLLKAPIEMAIASEMGLEDSSVYIDDADILSEINSYAENEVPSKCLEAVGLTKRILEADPGSKVVIWCIFVGNLFLMQNLLAKHGIDSRVLYGGTPTETEDSDDATLTRERIVKEFQEENSHFRVVLANPFAVGESISLHKACRHAVYLERNFNAAAFLQSKDRIHRYGLPPDAEVNYYYLLSANSVDSTIDVRLRQKEVAMLRVLESKEIPLISLNMEHGESLSDEDDIRAIIRDYVARHSYSRHSR